MYMYQCVNIIYSGSGLGFNDGPDIKLSSVDFVPHACL